MYKQNSQFHYMLQQVVDTFINSDNTKTTRVNYGLLQHCRQFVTFHTTWQVQSYVAH